MFLVISSVNPEPSLFKALSFSTRIRYSGESKWQRLKSNRRMVRKSAKTDGQTRSEAALSHELWRSLANPQTIFTRTSLPFTRVPAKLPHIHQSFGECAFCVRVAFRMCPRMLSLQVSRGMKSIAAGPPSHGPGSDS